MKTTLVLSAATIFAVTACSPTTQLSANRIALSTDLEKQAKALANHDLVDPISVQFRDLRAYQLSNGDVAICGQQNARNRFGGYVGFQALYLRFAPGPAPVLNSMEREFLAQSACGALDSGRGIPVSEG